MGKILASYFLIFFVGGIIISGVVLLDDTSKGSLKTVIEYFIIALSFPLFGLPMMLSWNLFERGRLPIEGDSVFSKFWKSGPKAGDCMRVKPGTGFSENPGLPMEDWQGLVETVNSVQVRLTLDTVSLMEIPSDRLEILIRENVEFDKVTLPLASLEPCQPRESEEDTRKAPFAAWQRLMMENLRFPFSAAIAWEMENVRGKVGERVLVKEFAKLSAELGIMLSVEKKTENFEFPLRYLEKFDLPEPIGGRLIAYREWMNKRKTDRPESLMD